MTNPMQLSKVLCLLAVTATILVSSPLFADSPPHGQSADLVLGDETILRLTGTVDGLSPQERVDQITERMTTVLSNAGVMPDNIAVYVPKSGAPVIYVLGRRAVKVDQVTATSEGYSDPVKLAVRWARSLQQVLPRICWRPPNAPEPVIPVDPPLIVTHNLSEVGGQVGPVVVYNKVVMYIRGPQPGGITAVERADILHTRIQQIAAAHAPLSVDDIAVLPASPDPTPGAEIDIAKTPVYTVTAADARCSHAPSAQALANTWARNLKLALHAVATPPAANATDTAAPVPDSPAPTVATEPIRPSDINKPSGGTGRDPNHEIPPATANPAPTNPSPGATAAPPDVTPTEK